MKNRATKPLLFITLACFALAGVPAQATEVWSDDRQITLLYPVPNGLTMYIDGADLRPTGTTTPCPGNRMHIPSSAPNYEVMASAFMLAFGSSFNIRVVYETDTLSDCDIRIIRGWVSKP
ncbi:hypothetical protein SAMN02745824_3363 [Parasphingorhabdus marina DSM 22363]|uniref:PEGA domain-containing protein n=1 Tax=Parasphingorhabdus marina DSM 22363 TaxID=1123272 RepID=A0A1N6HMN7_9SPHN|nr:hypothetical protein [Parasphingorhabdus marina]SIO20996.1 hypothetical protein SAMN02745824_3363 [Parasphingorhabdus marina DSM 22363]